MSWEEDAFPLPGNRRCSARANGCERLCRGRATGGAAPRGCWGGTLGLSGETVPCPLPCLPEGLCAGPGQGRALGEPSECPLHQGRLSALLPALVPASAAQRDVPLQCGPRGEAAVCKVVLWGLRGCLQSPLPSLSTNLQVLGGFHSLILQPGLHSCLFTPLHPVAQPHCRAGTTWVAPLLTRFSLYNPAPKKRAPSHHPLSCIFSHPGRGKRKGEKRDPKLVLVPAWGDSIAVVLDDELQREDLRLGHEFLSPNSAAICQTQLVN